MAKYFVTLAILCVFGAVIVRGFDKTAAIADFMAKAESCKTEVGANDGNLPKKPKVLVRIGLHREITDLAEMIAKKPASTPEGKCLRSCVMKKYEVMDGNGKFVPSVATKHAEVYTEGAADKMKIALEIIGACSEVGVSDDHCEASEDYGKCFMEQAIAHGITKFEF